MQTAALLPGLARRAEVTLWVHEPAWSPAIESDARVRAYVPDAVPWAELNAADVTIYQLASDAEQHGAIWQVFRQHPGIVILHEVNLQPLFTGMLARNEITPEDYAQLMEFHHGGERGAGSSLTGAGIESALGVVFSTSAGDATLGAALEMPTVVIPFVDPAAGNEASSTAEVDALFQLIDEVHANRSEEDAYWLAGRAGRALRPWFTGAGGRILLPRLASAVRDLCRNEGSPTSR